jgi:uncharacterized tellurite resistance protein B-like protein
VLGDAKHDGRLLADGGVHVAETAQVLVCFGVTAGVAGGGLQILEVVDAGVVVVTTVFGEPAADVGGRGSAAGREAEPERQADRANRRGHFPDLSRSGPLVNLVVDERPGKRNHAPMIKLQPKTLERIRDHFREVGQPASVAFTRPAQLDDPFAGDPDAKRRFEALFESMFLMIGADGDVSDSEREVLRGAVRGLTDSAVRTAHIDKMFDECKARAGEGLEKRLAAIAPVLQEDAALVEAAFSLSAAIAFADSEIKDEENELINKMAEAFGIDGDRADELLNLLENESVD